MSENSIHGQCPHCGVKAAHAFLPGPSPPSRPRLASTGESFGPTADHRLVCTSCEQSWEAAVVPKAQLDRLLAAVTGLDEAKRQIAMLRLIMSKDQVERAEKPRDETIRIHRAA